MEQHGGANTHSRAGYCRQDRFGKCRDIAQEVNRAKESLREQVSTLAIAGAEKILSKEIDKKAHSDMLSKLAKEL